MISTAPGQRYTATVEGAPEGLEGTIGIRVTRPDGSDAMARTTASIVEIADGVYVRDNLTAPATPGLYIVIWDTGDHWYDSLVLLDNFTWNLNPSAVGTHL